jgi:transcriptional regulator with XRE-family HTH domain
MALAETANIGKTVAARVGKNIREVRVKLELTQAQLAAPEFSISYISAIERGKIRPSLRALSVLAKRLDVPLTFLLEGSPEGVKEAQAVGYSPADSGPDQKVDIDLLQASVLVQQHLYEQANALLSTVLQWIRPIVCSFCVGRFIWVCRNIRKLLLICGQP